MLHGFFLLIVFLSEVAAIIAYGYWGFAFPKSMAVKWILGIGAPVLIIAVWSLFLSPKASFPVPHLLQLFLKLLVFGLAAAALYSVGRPKLALLFSLCVLFSHAMDYLLKENS
ncbi:YrdB family protein [Brevibacillus nitrificans]|uniref:YrdB family protein n=1 Tax=Brevibacillus nitrificans TaxID=651560 RepID=UPI002E1FBDAA|nr:YrdB family protein [Brevibacillus nitrificans]